MLKYLSCRRSNHLDACIPKTEHQQQPTISPLAKPPLHALAPVAAPASFHGNEFGSNGGAGSGRGSSSSGQAQQQRQQRQWKPPKVEVPAKLGGYSMSVFDVDLGVAKLFPPEGAVCKRVRRIC
jgi:hypothetical protein